MGFFNNDNKIEEVKNELVDIVENKVTLTKNDIAKELTDIHDRNNKQDENINNIIKAMKIMAKRMSALEHEKNMLIEEKKNTSSFSKIAKELNIKNFSETKLKFYLFEKNILDMNINEYKNSYSMKTDLSKADNELLKYIHMKKNNKCSLILDNEITNILMNRKKEIYESISRYETKNKQYKESKKSLESRNTENYRAEIGHICGYENKNRWIAIYKVFYKNHPNFYKDFNEYVEEHPDDKSANSKVKYIVNIMGEGNYLLKIACDLYA